MAPESALLIARFFHFGAVLLLLGTVLFRRRVASADVAAAMAARLGRWECWAALMALASAILWLLPQTAIAADGWASAGDPATVLLLVTDTQFGRIWSARIALAVIVALAAWRGWGKVLEGGAALLVLSLGMIGHGVMLSGTAGVLLQAVLGLHVAAAGAWVGALPAVVACLRAGGDAYPLAAAAASLRQFSWLGHGAVVIVIATGLALSRAILGDWPLSLGSSYRQLLAAKMLVVAVMIGVALLNGYGLLPRMNVKAPQTVRWLAASATLETVLAGLVLALVAAFGNLSPME